MKIINSLVLKSGTTLAVAVMGANVANLFFNAYLGRIISAEDFGVITLINTFIYIVSIFYLALSTTTNHQIAYLESHNGNDASTSFFKSLLHRVLFINIFLSFIWILTVPLINNFFNLGQNMILYLFTPLLLIYPLAFLTKGYLQGRLLFIIAACIVFIEPLLKLLFAFIFITLGLTQWIYASIYISAVLTGLIAIFIAWSKVSSLETSYTYKFPMRFFSAALITGVSTMSFLILDVILVKHYLSPSQAGEYAFLSLLGKIIYFLGSIFNVFIISVVSRNSKNFYKEFYLMFFGASIMSALGLISFGIYGNISIPLIFSNKANVVIPYALPYILAIFLFTLGSIIVTYHLAKKEYIFPMISVFISALIIIGISFFHSNITEIVSVLLTIGVLYNIILTIAHIKYDFFPRRNIQSWRVK